MDNAVTKAVFDEVEWLLKDCHPNVAEKMREDIDRYGRLNASCAALESFSGMRPRADDDLFGLISKRRAEVADVLAAANLEARVHDLRAGIYLAILFFSRCSDRQPVWLVNKSGGEVVYIGRKLYAFASDDDGVSDYRTRGSAFADGIAPVSTLSLGSKLRIDEYSMSGAGDFIGIHRLVLMIGGEQIEMMVSIGKLAGYIWKEEGVPGFHLLKRVQKGE